MQKRAIRYLLPLACALLLPMFLASQAEAAPKSAQMGSAQDSVALILTIPYIAVPPATTPPTATPSPTPDIGAWNSLIQGLSASAQQSGGQVAISLRELGADGQSWSNQGDVQFAAASTYKLPLLIAEAEGISNGNLSTNDTICYQSSEWEDGWYQDYVDGACYTRQELAVRVGTYSDNTAAHMLIDNLGGQPVLDRDAAAFGAVNSNFNTDNISTANDMAAIWATEISGEVGGAAAQSWLYPLLTHTAYEEGIPAGIPSNVRVVHKIGEYGSTTNDVALVLNGNHPYILVVMTDGTNQGGFTPIANISALVWQYEQRLG